MMAVSLKMIILSLILLVISATLIDTSDAWLFKRNKKPLAINGGWSQWSDWTSCHINTPGNDDYVDSWKGFLLASKSRNCNSPRPLNGGKDCEGHRFRYKQCGCENALGLANGRVSDEQLSASSELDSFAAAKGRLKGNSTWCAEGRISLFSNIYFQVAFKNFVLVNGLETEGTKQGRVTRYKMEYSVSGRPQSWTLYRDSKGRRRQGIIGGNVVPNLAKRVQLLNPVVAKYVRFYPVDSFGSVCMKTELYGCQFTCGQLFTNASGTIVGRSSPDVEQNCRWRVSVTNTSVITFDFVVFDLPCEFGYVEVWEASVSTPDSSTRKRFCGDSINWPYKFQGNDAWVQFKSNSTSEEIGFNLRYMSTCEKTVKLVPGAEFVVTSPGYPEDYPHNTDCKWEVSSPKGHYIEVQFLDFDVEESTKDDKCSNDYLRIVTADQNTRTYCSFNEPDKSMLVQGNRMSLAFVSDEAIGGRGFKLKLKSFDPNTVKTVDALVTKPATQLPPTTKRSVTQLKQDLSDKQHLDEKPTIPVPNSIPSNGMNLNRNSSKNMHHSKPKDSDDGDDTWTIIIIGAFSGIVLVLIIIVGGINIHRCLHGRNMYVQAKLEQTTPHTQKGKHEKERKRHVNAEVKVGLLERVPDDSVSPRIGSPTEIQEDNEDMTESDAAVLNDVDIQVTKEHVILHEPTNANNQHARADEEHDEPPTTEEDGTQSAKATEESSGNKESTHVSPVHSSGENSSVYDFVDCCEELDEITQKILDCVKDTSVDVQPHPSGYIGSEETVV